MRPLRKIFLVIFLAVFTALAFASPQASAASGINPQINFQGKLSDSSGNAVADGAQDFVFKLYTAPSGGSPIWTETWSGATRFNSTMSATATVGATLVTYTNDASEANLAVGDALYNNTAKDEVVITAFDTTANTISVSPTAKQWAPGESISTRISTRSGLFSVRLGSITSLATTDFNQDTLYLGVTVASDPEMTPRKRFTAVPQAFNANALGGVTSTEFLRADVPTTLSVSSTSPALTVNQGSGANAGPAAVFLQGNVGVHTSTPNPSYALDVEGGQTRNILINAPSADSQLTIQTGGAAYSYVRLSNSLGQWQIYNKPDGSFSINGNGQDFLHILSSGNVGIGTTAPGALLHVSSTASTVGHRITTAANADALQIQNSAGANLLRVSATGSLVVAPSSDTNAAIQFQNAAGTPILNVDTANQRVGIGTTSPGAMLELCRNCNGVLNNNGTQLRIKRANGNDNQFDFSISSGNALYIKPTLQSGDIEFENFAGNPTLHLTDAGNVGIATTTPAQVFTVNSAASNAFVVTSGGSVGIGTTSPSPGGLGLGFQPLLHIKNNNGAAGTLRLQSGNPGSGGAITVDENEPLRFFTNGGQERLRIDGSGNVGIGTPSPTGMLHVSSTGFTTTTARLTVNDTASWTAGNPFLIETQDGTARFKVSPTGTTYIAGNVGIGTTSPIDKLEVIGGIHSSGTAAASHASEIFLDYCASCGPVVGRIVVSGPNTSTNGAFQLVSQRSDSSNSRTLLLGDSNGNIGIGTTVPGARLDVRDNSSDTAKEIISLHNTNALTTGSGGVLNFYTTPSDVNTGRIAVLRDAASFDSGYMQFSTASSGILSTAMTINKNGNVGIGTTASPLGGGERLTVTSLGSSEGGVQIAGGGNTGGAVVNAASGGGLVLYTYTGAIGSEIYAPRITVLGSGANAGNVGIATTTPAQVFTVNSAASNAFVVTSGGSVGIGTTGPGVLLDLAQAASGNQIRFATNGGSGAGRQWTLSAWNTPNSFSIDESGVAPRLTILPGGNVGIATTTPAQVFTVNSAASNAFVVTSGGSVGIGTTNPGARLDVNGNFNIPANTWMTGGGTSLARASYFGFSPNYQVAQLGASGLFRGISLGADLTGNTSGGFTGNEIVIPNNVAIIAPSGANNGYLGVLRAGSDNKLYLGGADYRTLGTMVIDGTAGNVGIGTTSPTGMLSVSSTGSTTTSVRITINAGGSAGTANPLLIEDNAGQHLFRVNATGTVFTASNYNCALAANCYVSNQAADLAELTEVVGAASDYHVGDLVRQSPTDPRKVEKTTRRYDPGLYGIVTDRGQFLGNNPQLHEGVNAVKVSLVGYVKARVRAQNGAIAPGDYLTSSDEPGIAVKAEQRGRVIGIAREGFSDTTGTGLIEILLQPSSWLGPDSAIATVQNPAESVTSTGPRVNVSYEFLPSGTKEFFLANVLTPLKSLGIEIGQGLIRVARLVAEIVETKVLRTGNIEITSPAIGRSFIPTGASMVLVENSEVKSTSEIFLSPRGTHPVGSWSVSNVTDGSFFVHLSEPAKENIEFAYWIIQISGQASPTPLPQPPITVFDFSPTPSPVLGPTPTPPPASGPNTASATTVSVLPLSPDATLQPALSPSATSTTAVTSPSPSVTPTPPSLSPTPTPTPMPTPTPTPTPSPSPAPTPSASPSQGPSPSPTPLVSPSPAP